jgi:hypothetical protein
MAHYPHSTLASENRYRHSEALSAVARDRIARQAQRSGGTDAPSAAPAERSRLAATRGALGAAVIRLGVAICGSADAAAAASAG